MLPNLLRLVAESAIKFLLPNDLPHVRLTDNDTLTPQRIDDFVIIGELTLCLASKTGAISELDKTEPFLHGKFLRFSTS